MKILIIEDEQDLANSISDYLSEQQYLCEFAASFTEQAQRGGHSHLPKIR